MGHKNRGYKISNRRYKDSNYGDWDYGDWDYGDWNYRDLEKRLKNKKEKNTKPEELFIDIMDVDRPIKESAFSERQIDLLFNAFLKFRNTYTRSNFFTTRQKYWEMGIPSSKKSFERNWVMFDEIPSQFIYFVKSIPSLMKELRMSFRPTISHSGKMIESTDMYMILTRFEYWMSFNRDRNINIITIDDHSRRYIGENRSSRIIVQNLDQKWFNFRFHIAILNENTHWVSLLIDRKHNTFEYYDPLGVDIDFEEQKSPMIDTIIRLIEYATRRNPQMEVLQPSHRGGRHVHQREGVLCGMYVILYLYSRIVKKYSFKKFLQLRIDHYDVKNVLTLLFDTKPKNFDNKTSVNSSKFINYDYRIAAIEMARYMNYISEQFHVNTKQIHDSLMSKTQFYNDYTLVQREGIDAQQALLQIIPPENKKYIPEQLWYKCVKLVTKDPLTIYLRKISNSTHKKKSSTIIRKGYVKHLFDALLGWIYDNNIYSVENRRKIAEETEYTMKYVIHNVYVPILLFDASNKNKFDPNMDAATFLEATMSKQDTVSFGVSFLRYMDKFIKTKFNIFRNTILDTEFKNMHELITPTGYKNMSLPIQNYNRDLQYHMYMSNNQPNLSQNQNIFPVSYPSMNQITRTIQPSSFQPFYTPPNQPLTNSTGSLLTNSVGSAWSQNVNFLGSKNPLQTIQPNNTITDPMAITMNQCDMLIRKAQFLLKQDILEQAHNVIPKKESMFQNPEHIIALMKNDFGQNFLDTIKFYTFPINIDQFSEFGIKLNDFYTKNENIEQYKLYTNDFLILINDKQFQEVYAESIFMAMEKIKMSPVDDWKVNHILLSFYQFFSAITNITMTENRTRLHDLFCKLSGDIIYTIQLRKPTIFQSPIMNKLFNVCKGKNQHLIENKVYNQIKQNYGNKNQHEPEFRSNVVGQYVNN